MPLTITHCVLAATAGITALVGVTQPAARDLLNLSTAAVGDSLPPQWQQRAVRGAQSPTAVVREDGGVRYLRISGQRQAAWFTRDLRSQPLSKSGTAQLEYRLPLVPTGADLTVRERSDAALRLYFVVEGSRRVLPNTRLLIYSLGTLIDGPRVKRMDSVCDIRVPRISTLEWQRFTVSPATDAARECGWKDGRVVAVGLMQDTDQTGSPAEAHIRAVTWHE